MERSFVRPGEYGHHVFVTFNDNRLPTRFWAKVSLDPKTGCWQWAGAVSGKGYGQIQWKTNSGWRRMSVHRLVVLASELAIPHGMTIDHECENKTCVNPEHLSVVTSTKNIELYHRRNPYVLCVNGHRIEEAGVYVSNNHRRCKICMLAAQRRYRAKKKSGRLPKASRTHCTRGHLFIQENRTGRNCRLCENERNRNAYHRRRNHVS